MLSEMTIIKRSLVKALVIRTTCSLKDLPGIIGPSYGKISQYMDRQGAMAAGAPYLVYFNQDMDHLQVEIGIPVAMYVPDTEEIVMSGIPEGQYLRTLYTGPYDGIMGAYQKASEYMKDKGIEVKGGAYECYLNDPDKVKAEDLMTEILFQL